MSATQLLMAGRDPLPDLTTVNATTLQTPDCGGITWQLTVSYTCTSPNDSRYRIYIDTCTDGTDLNYSGWLTDLTTTSSSQTYDSGLNGGVGVTQFAQVQFRIRLLEIGVGDIENLKTSNQTRICGDPC